MASKRQRTDSETHAAGPGKRHCGQLLTGLEALWPSVLEALGPTLREWSSLLRVCKRWRVVVDSPACRAQVHIRLRAGKLMKLIPDSLRMQVRHLSLNGLCDTQWDAMAHRVLTGAFPRLKTLDLGFDQVAPWPAREECELRHLTSLHLLCNRPEDFRHVAQLTGLRHLALRCLHTSSESLTCLTNLRSLELSGAALGREGELSAQLPLAGLSCLSLERVGFRRTAEALRAASALRTLNLQFMYDREPLHLVFEQLPSQLESLRVARSCVLWTSALRLLATLQHLRELRLVHTPFAEVFPCDFPRLEWVQSLEVRCCDTRQSYRDVVLPEKLPSLTTLCLCSEADLTPRNVRALKSLRTLCMDLCAPHALRRLYTSLHDLSSLQLLVLRADEARSFECERSHIDCMCAIKDD